jgi:organic hydroperoxide reductase OsmC/OhrA
MLWFLHLCSDNGIIVLKYSDHANGTMLEIRKEVDFTEVILTSKCYHNDPEKIDLANSLHEEANKKCFVANSCNFPVHHQPVCV